MQNAVGTNPVAKNATEQQRRDNQQQAPEQPFVNRMRGDRRGKGDQRIQLEKQRNRITFQIAQIANKDEKQEQCEKKHLRHTAGVAEVEEGVHAVTSL